MVSECSERAENAADRPSTTRSCKVIVLITQAQQAGEAHAKLRKQLEEAEAKLAGSQQEIAEVEGLKLQRARLEAELGQLRGSFQVFILSLRPLPLPLSVSLQSGLFYNLLKCWGYQPFVIRMMQPRFKSWLCPTLWALIHFWSSSEQPFKFARGICSWRSLRQRRTVRDKLLSEFCEKHYVVHGIQF